MRPSQSESPSSLLRRLLPEQLPPVVALIAWLLIISGCGHILHHWLHWHSVTPVWPGDPTLRDYISTILLPAVECCCGIALLRSAWWARRATVAVLVIALLYRVATYIGLDRLLLLGNPVHLDFPLWALESSLLFVLGCCRNIATIYFLTLPRVAAAWPRQPNILLPRAQKFPSLHAVLLRCYRSIGRLFPPVLPAEAAYIAVVMLINASRYVIGYAPIFFQKSYFSRLDPMFFQPLFLLGLSVSIAEIVLPIAIIRLARWALIGTIIVFCGQALLIIVPICYARSVPFEMMNQYSPSPKPSISHFLLLFFWQLPRILPIAIQAYFLTRPRVLQIFGWAPVTTGMPVEELLDDLPGD